MLQAKCNKIVSILSKIFLLFKWIFLATRLPGCCRNLDSAWTYTNLKISEYTLNIQNEQKIKYWFSYFSAQKNLLKNWLDLKTCLWIRVGWKLKTKLFDMPDSSNNCNGTWYRKHVYGVLGTFDNILGDSHIQVHINPL